MTRKRLVAPMIRATKLLSTNFFLQASFYKLLFLVAIYLVAIYLVATYLVADHPRPHRGKHFVPFRGIEKIGFLT